MFNLFCVSFNIAKFRTIYYFNKFYYLSVQLCSAFVCFEGIACWIWGHIFCVELSGTGFSEESRATNNWAMNRCQKMIYICKLKHI